jgi:hypothetical protein
MWVEAATELRAAEERMSQLAYAEAGEYFVFDQETQQIVARTTMEAAALNRTGGTEIDAGGLRTFGSNGESKKEG